jgi:invasion protein IalB
MKNLKSIVLGLTLSSCIANWAHADSIPFLDNIGSRENIASGDFLESKRHFGKWSLACEEVLSKSLKNCSLQSTQQEDATKALEMIFGVGENRKLQSYFTVMSKEKIASTAGVIVSVGGRAFSIEDESLICNRPDNTFCLVNLEFDELMAEAFLKSTSGFILYSVANDEGEFVQRRLTFSLNGFAQAKPLFDEYAKGTIVSGG